MTSSLLVFERSVDRLNAPRCLFKLLAHSSDTHTYHTRHVTRGLFTIPKSRTDYERCTVLRGAMTIRALGETQMQTREADGLSL